MKRKTSILINIASLCLCIGALVVGVISAKTVTASLSGSIGFKAYNCNVDFTGTITGAVLSTASTNKVSSSPTLYIHPTGEPTSSNTNTTINVDGDSQTTNSSVKFGNLGFAVNSSSFLPYDITMTFSITNKSEFAICASLNLTEFNVDPSITYTANEYKLKLGDKNSSTKTSTFTITIKAGSSSINATSNASKINLTFEKFNVPKATDMGFTVTDYEYGEEGDKCIMAVPAKTDSTTLTIPAYFSDASDNLIRVKYLSDDNDSTLENLDGYTNIVISEGCVCIGTCAFSGCSSLASITLPNSLKKIEYAAFENTSLSSINIPQNVTYMGDAAFYDCTSLTSLTIPQNVTEINHGPLVAGCTSLTSLVVAEGNPVYDSRDNCNAIIETATNTLVSGSDIATIPNSVTSIGEYAFIGCTGLTSITIPSSVTSIGSFAFYDCTVTSLKFAETKIWEYSRYSDFRSGSTSTITINANTDCKDKFTAISAPYYGQYWRVKPAG